MTNTPNLTLPLLEGNQAQKHVTVNEGLSLLDGLTQLVIESRTVTSPSGSEVEGSLYFLPVGAVNEWAGQGGKLALKVNGAWRFVVPKIGWQAYILAEELQTQWEGSTWVKRAYASSVNGAKTTHHIVEIDHVITPGTVNTTALAIPQYSLVYGVTGRILTTVSGTLTSWDVGTPGDGDRYANNIGLAQGSWINGPSFRILTYYNQPNIQLSATGGDFAGGVVRLALHYDILTPPNA